MENQEKKFEGFPVEIFVDPHHRPFRACFKIGVQTFHVCEREDKKEAEWYVGVLKTAFANYAYYLGIATGEKLKELEKENQELLSKLQCNDSITEKALNDTKSWLLEAIILLVKLVPIANNRGNLTPTDHDIIKEVRDFLSDENKKGG